MTPNDDDDADGSGRVMRLADYDSRPPGRVVAELRDYWWSLRKGRAIPARSDIDPAGLRGTLDFAFVLERIAPGAARFRLAGRHLVDLLGMEVRGMPLCALMNAGSRGRLSDVVEAVFKAPQIAEIDLMSPAGYGRAELTGRMVILPLKSDLGDVTRALGCVATEGVIGTAPRRFDLIADRASPVIEGARVLTPSPSMMAGFSEPAETWQPARPPMTPDLPPRPAIPVAETPEERRLRFRVISND